MGSRYRFFALFLLSTALIMYELAAMRMFAITSWSHFGSLVISTALLGFGLSGTILTFVGKRLEPDAPSWLYRAATLFMPALAAAHVLGQRIPFNPIFIGSDPLQLVWIGLYYVVYGVPFFFGAAFIGIAFLAHEGKVHGLYFWNMLGSSIGGLAIVPLMYLLPPASLVLPVLVLAGGASLVAALERDAVPALLGDVVDLEPVGAGDPLHLHRRGGRDRGRRPDARSICCGRRGSRLARSRGHRGAGGAGRGRSRSRDGGRSPLCLDPLHRAGRGGCRGR